MQKEQRVGIENEDVEKEENVEKEGKISTKKYLL